MKIEHSTSNIQRRMVAVFVFLVCAAVGVQADTASRLYEQGKYAEAFARYTKAAEKEKENWPLFYNLGAAAYKAGRPDEAAKAFERASGSPDKLLQARSFYNLGNSCFRIGEAAEKQAPQQAMPVYEHSLKSYESSLALDPNDADAKHNLEVVKKKLEELKKQQEQQQQQKQDHEKKDKQDQKQQDSQKQSEQQKQDQQKQDQQSQKKDAKEKQQQQEQQAQPQHSQTNNLEQVQAAMLLDNLREEERNWNFFPELQMNLKDSAEPAKDW